LKNSPRFLSKQWKINNNYDGSVDMATPTSTVTKAERKQQLDNIDAALSLIDAHDSNHNLKHASFIQETADLEKGLKSIDRILKKLGVPELDHDLAPIYDATSWYSKVS
jgi:hypothetical protein